MPLLEWTPDLSVTVEAMDDDHRRLIATINDLNDAMKAGRSREATGAILDRLTRYTQEHFAAEEAFMAEIGYPQLERHRAEHRVLLKQVAEFRETFERGDTAISVRLMRFLTAWLRDHLVGSDARYGIWASSRQGVGTASDTP